MKKKRIIIPIIVPVLVLAFILGTWYFTPKKFLSGVASTDVDSISVFNGSTGNSFNVTSREQIMYIVENIHGVEMKKEKFSSGYDGFVFSLTFKDASGKTIESFIINSKYIIRDDPFFYRSSRTLCFEYLKALEEELFRPNEPTAIS